MSADTASNIQQAAVTQQIVYALAAKSQSVSRVMGDAMLELIDAAMPTGKAEGKGAKLDVVA